MTLSMTTTPSHGGVAGPARRAAFTATTTRDGAETSSGTDEDDDDDVRPTRHDDDDDDMNMATGDRDRPAASTPTAWLAAAPLRLPARRMAARRLRPRHGQRPRLRMRMGL
jgi:hypothetical protein